MSDEKTVPLSALRSAVTTLLRQNFDLGVSMQVLRSVLMNARSGDLPVSAEYLQTVERNIRSDPRFVEASKMIEDLGKSADIETLLRYFEGPLQ